MVLLKVVRCTPGLQIAGDSEAVLQANDRAVVQAEEVFRERTEIAAPEVAGEAVRDTEVALMTIERRRGWQVDQVQLGGRILGLVERCRGGGRRRALCACAGCAACAGVPDDGAGCSGRATAHSGKNSNIARHAPALESRFWLSRSCQVLHHRQAACPVGLTVLASKAPRARIPDTSPLLIE